MALMKRNLNSVFFLGILLCFSSCGVKERSPLDELIHDFSYYKTYCEHRGDLYEHSMWTEQYLSQWAHGQTERVSWVAPLFDELSAREKYILALAGLLHDIGKAGDPDCSKYKSYKKQWGYIYYHSKKDHEKIGCDYILHDIKDATKYPQGYVTINGLAFSFKTLFESLKISPHEQMIIALLVGSHKFFSTSLFKNREKADTLVQKVFSLAREINFEQFVDEKMIDMIILLNVADTYATYFPVEKAGHSLVFGAWKFCPRVRSFPKRSHQELKLRMGLGMVASVKRTAILKSFRKYKALAENSAVA